MQDLLAVGWLDQRSVNEMTNRTGQWPLGDVMERMSHVI